MPARILLFTDTLGDVNGVSRFLQSLAHLAHLRDHPLAVLTSTRFPVPDLPTIINFKPLAAAPIPGYPDLQLALPPARAISRFARAFRPDCIHVSTPGPVGVLGTVLARRLAVPRLATYHTDFPAYADHLFADPVLTSASRFVMRRFYRHAARVLIRSDAYRTALLALGVPALRLHRLTPGIRVEHFGPRFRDRAIWKRLDDHPASALRVLYVGRVSVEKNLPLLAEVWREVHARLHPNPAVLTVVGDGPYRDSMQQSLAGTPASFMGVRHAEELSRVYASSDLFVFPSTTDTLGQVVLEAQASGLPVLVSNRGGPREVVRHAATGMILPAERGAWVSAIIELLGDAPRRGRLAEAAYAHARRFTLESAFEDFLRIHEDAAAEDAGHVLSFHPNEQRPSALADGRS